MKEKTFVISVFLVCLMALGMAATVYGAAQTPNMLIHIFLSPDPENQALEMGTIDFNDWPLAKDWIDRWALMPETVTMRDYVELGMMEIDINNQKWPTGSSTSKFYSTSDTQSVKSVYFRKAVACLLDRDKIISDVLKGYGFRLDVPVPPSQSAYMDMANYTVEGLIYNYNKTRAIEFLNAGGFTLGPDGEHRIDPTTGTYLSPLTFYIRMDDPNRRRAGEMLAAELQSVGIPVNAIVTEKTVCYKNVMVLYNYHLYTGGWSLSTVPDQYYDLYSSYTYYGPTVGWSNNYPGFCNHDFDYWATKVKYPATVEEAQEAAKVCGYLFLKYCAIVPMWSAKAVKAYRTGWDGVVNNVGYGTDNYYTFLNAHKTGDDTIDYGFKSNIEQLNVIHSQWVWDWDVLGLIYEGMVGNNPFSQSPTEGFIADSWTLGSWDASGVGGDTDATYINFHIRDNIYWHNATGQPRRQLTADDVAFSFNYTKACGTGVAWNYPLVEKLDHVTVNGWNVTVYYSKKSAWAFLWAGGLPIINPDIWSNVEPSSAGTEDPTVSDVNHDGVTDLIEDGCGAWIYTAKTDTSVSLVADQQYYLSADYISTRLGQMFHDGAGDIDSNGVVNVKDLGAMARALGTNINMTNGTGWNQYNPNCDLNHDGVIDLTDLAVVTTNYGKTMG